MLFSLKRTFVSNGATVQKGDGLSELNLNIPETIAMMMMIDDGDDTWRLLSTKNNSSLRFIWVKSNEYHVLIQITDNQWDYVKNILRRFYFMIWNLVMADGMVLKGDESMIDHTIYLVNKASFLLVLTIVLLVRCTGNLILKIYR